MDSAGSTDPAGPMDEGAARASVAAVAHGFRAGVFAQITVQALRLLTNVILARMLVPADFGVVAVALVIIAVLEQLKDAGTGSAVIQRPECGDRLLNSVFYLNIGLGVVLCGALFAAAEPFARLLGSAEAAGVLRALAVVSLLTATGQIHQALLRRSLRFGTLAWINIASTGCTTVVSIVGAALGLAYWALALGFAAGALLSTALAWWLDPWRPGLCFDLNALRDVLGYSGNLLLSNLAVVFYSQVDKAFVGQAFGPAAVGVFTMAQRTVIGPATGVGSVVSDVTFPAFSRRQDDDAALGNAVIRSSNAVAVVMAPALAVLAALADPLVTVLLGGQWRASVPIIVLLCPVAAVQTITKNVSQIVLAKGRSDVAFWLALAHCALLPLAMWIGARWGLTGAAAGYTVAFLALTPALLAVGLGLIALPCRRYLLALLPLLAGAVIAGGCALVSSWGIEARGWGPMAQLAAGTAAAVAGYGVCLAVTRPRALDDLAGTLRARIS